MIKRFLVLFMSVGLVYGQDPVYEELTVTYKDVRVHVVDRDGNPVKGLTLADFILRERGAVQQPTYFEEVDLTSQVVESEVRVRNEGGQAKAVLEEAPETVDRFMVLFVDSSHMTPGNFRRVKRSINEFIETRVGERDFVKIVQFDNKFDHVTGFTKDRDILKQNVEDMVYQGRLRKEILRSQRSINNLIEEWDNIEVPDMRPSYELNINQLIQEKGRIKADFYRTFYLNMLSMGNMLEHIKGAKSIFLFTGGGYLETNPKFSNTADLADRLGRVMNRANATIYTMLFAASETLGGAGDNLNLKNTDPGFGRRLKTYSSFPPSDQFTDPAANTVMEDNRQLESAPSVAAESTGGLYLRTFNADDARDQLRKLNDVSRHYYRLGYALDDPERRVAVSIKLRDKQKGWKLLYGKTFEPETPYLELKKDEQDIAFKAMLLYGQNFRLDLDSNWSYELLSRENGGFRVPVVGSLKTKSLPENGFELGFAALNEKKEMLDLTTMRIKDVELENNRFNYYELLLTDAKPKYVRASIRDLDTGDISFFQLEVEEEVKSGPHIPSLMMASADDGKALGLNHLRVLKNEEAIQQASTLNTKKSKKKLAQLALSDLDIARRDEDPFNMGDAFFNASVKPYEFTPGVQYFMFHVQEPIDAEGQIQFLVKSKTGYLQVPGRIGKKYLDDGHNLHVQGALNTSKLPEGEYSLFVRVVYKGKQPIMAGAPFKIVKDTKMVARNSN